MGGTGGVGGVTGGTGGVTEPPCTLGQQKTCYDGPSGTMGVGICVGGTSSCQADGMWGPCTGQILPKFDSCGSGVDENCDGVVDCTGKLNWGFARVGTGTVSAGGIAVDAADNLVVTGGFQGSIDFGGGSQSGADAIDPYVVKVSPSGQHLWTRTFKASLDQVATSIAVHKNSGDVLVAGYFSGSFMVGNQTLTSAGGKDIFVFQLDKDGNPLWAKSFGGIADDRALGVGVATNGDVYVVGGYIDQWLLGGTTLPKADSNAENGLLFKLDKNGNSVWAKGYGDASSQVFTGVAVSKADEPWVVGTFTGTIAGGGNCANNSSAGAADIFMAKIDATGMCTDSYGWGAAGDQWGIALTPYPGGTMAVGMILTGNVTIGATPTLGDASWDIAFAKIASGGGNVNYVKRYGEAVTHQFLQGMSADPGGNMLLSGSFAGHVNFSVNGAEQLTAVQGYDRYVAKIDNSGVHLWSKSFPNSAGAFTYVATDSQGRVNVFGNLLGQTDLGAGTIGVAGAPLSMLVFQLAP